MIKNIGKNMNKSLRSKYGHAKQSSIHIMKGTSKRTIQKTAEATGNLSENKIDDKITQE